MKNRRIRQGHSWWHCVADYTELQNGTKVDIDSYIEQVFVVACNNRFVVLSSGNKRFRVEN